MSVPRNAKHVLGRAAALSRPRSLPCRCWVGGIRRRRGTSGAVALEFALVGPIAIYLVMIGIGVSRLFLISVLLHDALIETARYGATGSDSSTTRIANIAGMMTSLSHVNPTVTVTSYSNTNSQGQSNQGWNNLASGTPYTSSYGPPGGPSDVVVYSATYTDPLVNSLLSVLPLLGHGTGSGPIATLSQSTIVQNEPYFTS